MVPSICKFRIPEKYISGSTNLRTALEGISTLSDKAGLNARRFDGYRRINSGRFVNRKCKVIVRRCTAAIAAADSIVQKKPPLEPLVASLHRLGPEPLRAAYCPKTSKMHRQRRPPMIFFKTASRLIA
jgi:hypothetical protein